MQVSSILNRQQRYLKDTTLNENIVDWINLAMSEIYLSGRFSWTRKNVELNYIINDGYVVIPSDVQKIQYVELVEGDFKTVLSDTLMVKSNEVLSSSGTYKWYEGGMSGDKATGYNRTIVLSPNPDKDKVLRLYYYSTPDKVEAADDYIPIPDGAEAPFNELINWYRLDYEEEAGSNQTLHLQRYAQLLKRTIESMFPDYDSTEQKITTLFSETGFPY